MIGNRVDCVYCVLCFDWPRVMPKYDVFGGQVGLCSLCVAC